MKKAKKSKVTKAEKTEKIEISEEELAYNEWMQLFACDRPILEIPDTICGFFAADGVWETI